MDRSSAKFSCENSSGALRQAEVYNSLSFEVERPNGTIQQHDSGVPTRIISDHPKDWNFYADALTYSYINQAHAAADCTPMELVVSRALLHLATDQFTPALYVSRTVW